MSRLEKFFPTFTNTEITCPFERARRLDEHMRRHLPSQFVADAQRMREDRIAFRLAIRRYEEQRTFAKTHTVEVVA